MMLFSSRCGARCKRAATRGGPPRIGTCVQTLRPAMKGPHRPHREGWRIDRETTNDPATLAVAVATLLDMRPIGDLPITPGGEGMDGRLRASWGLSHAAPS